MKKFEMTRRKKIISDEILENANTNHFKPEITFYFFRTLRYLDFIS
jgi:hypothetical protein